VAAGSAALAAAFIAPIPAAVFAGGMLWWMTGADFSDSARTWWFGHALSVSVLSSLGLSLTRREIARYRAPARAVEAVVLLGGLAAISYAVFFLQKMPIAFAAMPLLLLIAVRLRMLGITLGLAIISILAVGGSMQGLGPYSVAFEGAERALMAQMLVLFGYLPIMLVAALLEERDRFADRARLGQVRAEKASEAKSRLLANVAHEIKSPVGGVIGIGELWKSGQLGPVSTNQARAAACFALGEHLHRIKGHDAAVPWWREAHALYPENWTYKRQAWTLVTTPEGATENDLMQGPNEVYSGNWLDDVIAAGGGGSYSVRPQLE
jgi:signal transduction histidine kinase